MNPIIFVYGTLQRGERQDLSNFLPTPWYLGSGAVRGWLYDLGHCPALILDDEGPLAHGELFELDPALFAELDAWEARCGAFTLVTVAAAQTSDAAGRVLAVPRPVCCVVYQGAVAAVRDLPFLPDGRWPRRAERPC